MGRVTEIGGVFFRADDPAGLMRWYAEHLGVSPPPASYDQEPWKQEAGPTVFAPMSSDSEHFGRPAQQWSINFRVRNLDAMVAQLRLAGIQVEEAVGVAYERLRKRSEFWTHLAAYLLVNALIVIVWFGVGSGFFWPIFPLAGWGIGLFFHGMDVFRRPYSEERIRAR